GDGTTDPEPEPEPSDLPPAPSGSVNFMGLLEENVEAGTWTQAEGLIFLLGLFAEPESNAEWLSDTTDDLFKLSGLIDAARKEVAALGSGEDANEINRLLGILVPDTTHIDLYALPLPKDNLRRIDRTPQLSSAVLNEQLCRDAWLSSFPSTAADTVCFYKETVKGEAAEATLYLPQFDLDDPRYPYIVYALAATQESINTYEKWGTMPDFQMQFSPLSTPGTTLADADPNTSLCHINVYGGAFNQDPEDFQQTLAHEIFHCYQFFNYKGQVYGPSNNAEDWWLEGTAQYFSNVVYPAANDEYKYEDSFTEDSRIKSITKMDYETFLFFQFLGNTIGDEGILALLNEMPTNGSHDEQTIALSKVANMELLFHQFAQQFVDRSIADSSGVIVMQDPLRNDEQGLNAEREVTKEGDVELDTSIRGPFVIARIKVTYKSGARYDQTAKVEALKMSTRDLSEPGVWLDFPESINACSTEQEELIILTTTDPNANRKFELQFKEGGAERCLCFSEVTIFNQVFEDDFVTFNPLGFFQLRSDQESDLTWGLDMLSTPAEGLTQIDPPLLSIGGPSTKAARFQANGDLNLPMFIDVTESTEETFAGRIYGQVRADHFNVPLEFVIEGEVVEFSIEFRAELVAENACQSN
ncbi:MAG: DUF6055 domain-containing protein, partial [Chloroflexota bacterium]